MFFTNTNKPKQNKLKKITTAFAGARRVVGPLDYGTRML